MANDGNLLEIEQLDIAFGRDAQPHTQQHKAVSGMSLSIQKGQCLGLVGESGSGKTLTALSILQLLPNAARVNANSKILFHGENLLNYSENAMRKIRGRCISMIFQDAMSAFNPVFTIGQQLTEILKYHQRISHKKAKQKAIILLDEVGIKDPEYCLKTYPHQLSGGMRQRAMIAMALSCEPELLIADEPSTALDVTIQAQVITLLKKLKQTRNMTLLFISHDLAVVSQIADDVAVMEKGTKVEDTRASEFFEQPQHDYSQKLLRAIPPTTTRHTKVEKQKTLLSLQNLKVYFPIKAGILKRTVGHVKAVDDISFTIPAGQTLALVGESGSGKTTTGKAILKLLNKTSGNIIFNGTDLSHLSRQATQQLRRDSQIVFQDPYSALNPRMLIVDSIAEGLIAQKHCRNRQALFNKVDQALIKVGLPIEAKWRYPHEFSGGQRQRICIARALALEPKLLILDEPTSALDVSIQMQILELLAQLQQEQGLSYLLITHNLSVVAYMAHHTAVMRQGKIVEQGQTNQILNAPQHTYTQQLLACVPMLITPKTGATEHA